MMTKEWPAGVSRDRREGIQSEVSPYQPYDTHDGTKRAHHINLVPRPA